MDGGGVLQGPPADVTDALTLSTPPSPAERFIRCSLLPNLVQSVAKNERYFDHFSIFETAKVFRDRDYTLPQRRAREAAL